MNRREWIGIGIAVIAIVGGLGVACYALWLDSKKRILRHRERLAMIEKGLMPAAFLNEPQQCVRRHREDRRNGVFMICLGIGLGAMFGLQQDSWRHVWIGVVIAMFGVSHLINALLDDSEMRKSTPPSSDPNPPAGGSGSSAGS
jgi:Domain of unknown function (DUF6249)